MNENAPLLTGPMSGPLPGSLPSEAVCADPQLRLECSMLTVAVGAPERRVLTEVTFSACSGEIIGIVGANGAGKSTLLRLIGGLQTPTSGEARVNGEIIEAIGPRRYARICAFMHQDTVMPFDFTVREVVEMGRHPYHSALSALTPDDNRIIDDSLEEAGCLEFADKQVTRLSGGERQRVMFARVLAQDTPMLLLDEPTASLDIRYAGEILDTVRRLARRGRLAVIVLHDLRAAARLCDRVLMLHEGLLIAAGEPVDVLHEGHISYAFGIRARTYRNPLGQWDFSVDD